MIRLICKRSIGQPPLTARRATWLTLQRPEQRKDDSAALVARLKSHHADLDTVINLSSSFAHLVRQRLSEQLYPWLELAASSTLTQFQRFDRSLQEDYEAVNASVTLAISNGQVEGQINRLKMLKRQM